MNFKDLVRAGMGSMKSVSRGYGSTIGGGFFDRLGAGEGKNWAAEAGVRYDNSIVYAALMGAWNWMTEVDIYVRRPKGDQWEEVPGHPITQMLQNPNPWYEGATWMGGCIVSELAGPGYSCTFKHRSSSGKLIGLEYVPHFAIWPFTNPTSGNFIDFFQMNLAGGYARVEPQNILMQRYGFINPKRPQTCVGPLLACILEIATDKEAANYVASILKNMGVTAHSISPSMTDEDGKPFAWTTEQLAEIEAVINNKITGDNRGKPIAWPLPVKVDKMGTDPSAMNVEGIRNISEERVCAVLQIHPLSLYLGTALQQSNNRASSVSAFTQTARSFTKPYMRKKAAQLTRDLIPELGEPGEEVCFRIDQIEALQEDKSETAKRKALSCGGPWLTPNEVRLEEGKVPVEGGDDLRSSSTPGKDPAEPDDDDLNDDDKPSKGK